MGAVRRLGGAALAAALACALAAVGSAPAAGAPAVDQRPNVVVIMTDDQTQDSISYMDRVNELIAGRGATFANSFTNWPLCCPSRATLLTGQYAHNHGVLGNQPPTGGVTRLDDTNTLPVWLQGAGYHTIHVGKYLNGYGIETDPAYVPPGWDEWYGATAGTTQSVYDYTLNENGALIDYATAESDFKQDVFTGLAVDAIARRAPAGPFMLAVNYTAPHGGGPNPNPNPPSDCGRGAPKPAPRHATSFDSEPLPQPPSFNEADLSDKPLGLQSQPPITADEFADIQRRYVAGSSRSSPSTRASRGSSRRSTPPASSTTP